MGTVLIINPIVVAIVWISFVIWWMINMVKFTKENRIIQSMTLKALLKYFESKGEKIDIEGIQKQVEKSVN